MVKAGRAKLKVLVVEDEALVAMLIEDVLDELGHEVVGLAGRLEEALALAQRVEADVAVVDLNLGGRHTYPVAEVLRRREIPFIFATGYGAAGVREEWRGQIVVQKPFEPDELDAAIASARRN